MRSIALYVAGLMLIGHTAVAQNGNPNFQSVTTNALTVNGDSAGAGIRTVLGAATTYYVNANSGGTATCGVSGGLTCQAGSDSNNGLSVSTPFLTLQHAYNVITETVDTAQYSVTINLAHGSSTNYDLVCNLGAPLGANTLIVAGDSSAITAVTVTDPNSGYGLQAQRNCRITYNNIVFADSAGASALGHILVNGGQFSYTNLNFGGMTVGTDMSVTASGNIIASGGLTVTGGAPTLLSVVGPGSMNFGNFHIAMATASMNFSSEVALIADGGEIIASPSTFNGAGLASVTGSRCLMSGVSSTSSGDVNSIYPGNANCIQNSMVGSLLFTNGNTQASFGTCSLALNGAVAYITNSATTTWGATITGGGSSPVLAFCDGTNWTVMGK